MLWALGHARIVVAGIDSGKWDTAKAMGAELCLDLTASDAVAQLQKLDSGLWGAVDLVGSTD